MPDQKMPKKELIHDLEGPKRKKVSSNSSTKTLIFTVLVVLILGVGTGYIASNVSSVGPKTPLSINEGDTSGEIKKGFTTGVKDTEQFPNDAEGVLREGGIEDEGEYHLERPGGESQNVYLTSTTIDLSQFVGRKIKVYGKTYEGKYAGWLMDAGWVEVL